MIFDAVIFDFDGVILNSEPFHYEACCALLKDRGLYLSYEEYLEKYLGLADKEMLPKFLNERGYSFSENEINFFIKNKVDVYTQIINSHINIPMVTGVEQYIDMVYQRGKKLAIYSGSMRKEIDAVITKFKAGKLKAYFNTIVSSEDVKCSKPSPEGYLLTAARLQTAPDKCLVIEDSPTGIQAAKAAGMYVIALQTSYEMTRLQKADQIEKDFTCLLQKIRA